MKKVLLITAFIFGLPMLLFSVGPELDLSVGFADRFRSGTVTPVSLFIRSPDAVLDAELIIEFTTGNALREGDRYTFRRSLHLSAGTPGVFRFSLPMEVSSYPLRARLEQRGLLLAETEKELRPLNVDRPLIVGLSRRPSLDSLIPVLGSHFQRPVELVYPRTEFLPVSPEAWEGVSLVIWHNLSPEIPDPASLEALGLWIEGGGNLIIIGGPWLAGRRFPQALLPAFIQTPRLINGIPVYLPDEKQIEGGRGEDGRAEDIIVFPRGRGRVFYITRDMVSGALAGDERQNFWSGLIGQLNPLEPRETKELESIKNIIAAAWFQDDRSLLPSLRGPLILVGLFSLTVGGLLLAGLRIKSSRYRGLQLGIILFLSAGFSTLGVLKYLPSGNETFQAPGTLNLLVTGNYGTSRLHSLFRFVSPGGESRDWPLPDRGVSTLKGGGDLIISYSPSGPLLEDLKLEPWAPVELVHDAILPGNAIGDGAEPTDIEGIRHNGHRPWFDVMLIDSGKVSQIASEWIPGEILTFPVGPSGNSGTPGFPHRERYSRVIEALVPVSKEMGRIVMARDEDDNLVLHLGDGL